MIKSILTPTRNRPANCERLIKSGYNSTKTRKNVEMLFYVDEDDPAIEAYKSLHWHAQKEPTTEEKIEEERQWRDVELKNTDWIVPVTDHPQHDAYLTYRQELRDYPSQSDFPNGTRPQKP